jgi:hypothetical protein
MEENNIFKRLFSSIGRHLKFLAIAAAFSTVVYGGIYLALFLSGRI